MNAIHTTFLLVAAFLVVFAEAALDGPRRVLGVQLDLLTPLVIYAALRGHLASLALVTVCGALWLDALSANPLGVSVLPLFLPAFFIHTQRAFILRDERFAQSVLGAAASVAFAILSLVLLLTMGRSPAVGWGTLWVLFVAAVSGALLVPVYTALADSMEGILFYQARKQPTFDPIRQIKRDRHLS